MMIAILMYSVFASFIAILVMLYCFPLFESAKHWDHDVDIIKKVDDQYETFQETMYMILKMRGLSLLAITGIIVSLPASIVILTLRFLFGLFLDFANYAHDCHPFNKDKDE